MWSVISVHRVVQSLDHLPSLSFLFLQASSFSKLRSTASVSSSRQLRKVLDRTGSSGCGGALGRVPCEGLGALAI